jgi:hypothetical protein
LTGFVFLHGSEVCLENAIDFARRLWTTLADGDERLHEGVPKPLLLLAQQVRTLQRALAANSSQEHQSYDGLHFFILYACMTLLLQKKVFLERATVRPRSVNADETVHRGIFAA